MKRIFVSSVQREFAQVRKQLKTHLSRNPAYRRLLESFVFEEDIVATDCRTDEVYLDELAKCDLYLGLADCRAAWLSDPIIDDFTITIYRPADKSQIEANKADAGLIKDEEIIASIINNPTLSMQEYANKLQIKYSVLRGRIAKLKAKGLRHEGPRKSGRWIFAQS